MSADPKVIVLAVIVVVAVGGYLFNCRAAGKLLSWKEWGEFNGD